MEGLEIIQICKNNPPEHKELQNDYFERIASLTPSLTFSQINGRIKRFLRKEGFKMSINGLKNYLRENSDKGKKTVEQNGSDKSYEYKGEKSIQSLEEAIEFFEIDLSKWEVTRFVCNSWDVVSKDFGKRTNYQVKVWLSPIKSDLEELKKELLEAIPQVELKLVKTPTNGSLMVEPCIFDHHFGKVGLDLEDQVNNWSLQTATQSYHKAINHFVDEVKGNSIQEIVLPIGNDYFNIDTSQYTTTKGTPQLSSMIWQKMYLQGCKTKVIGIQALVQIAPVSVYVVPGNHDWMLSFTLGEYLKAAFKDNPHVTIDNTPEQRKYHAFGNVLSGYTHGDKIKPSNLHHTMSVDVPQLFGRAKFRHLKVGHLHKESEKKVITKTVNDEFAGVNIFWCPSLCPTDVWHYQNLYTGNERKSKTFVYHKNDGLQKVVYCHQK